MGSASATAPSPFLPLLHPRHRLPPPQSHNPNPNPNPNPITRRSTFLLSTASTTATLTSLFFQPTAATAEENEVPGAASAPPDPATIITDRIFMDFSLCPSFFSSGRTLGSTDLAACPDSEPLGRIVFGLYGKLLPLTVTNFKAMCTSSSSSSSSYRGTLVHKILQGQYFAAGRQGRRDKGEVSPPSNLSRNTESVDSRAFQLKHLRPGTLSLCLSENDDYDDIKIDSNYRNVEFLVTTGPGPCPQLDNENIVFGTVLEGLDVVTTIATIPTYKPGESIRQFNDFAEFLGDERAQNARAMWNRPLKTVYISNCGELKVAKPSLSPSLP